MKNKDKLVKLKLWGDLGEWFKDKEWEFAAKSVKDCIYALNTLTGGKLTNYFIQNNKLQAKYRVLINGKDFIAPTKEINEENYELINQSELVMEKEIETIDIVPWIENNDSDILGIITLIVGVVLLFVPGAQGFGVALIAAGLAFLLARPPKFQDFREPDKAGRESYLFGGPTNIIGEGGPVPLGYGKVLVGSQVISSAYKIVDYITTR